MNRETDKLLYRLNEELNKNLEKRNSAKLGDATLVRIPDLPGRIRKIPRSKDDGSFSVEFISKRWYDEEAGQTRNEKHIIGLILAEYPQAMLPNENYEDFFDIDTGRLRKEYRMYSEAQDQAKDKPAGNNPVQKKAPGITPSEKTADKMKNGPNETDQDEGISEERFKEILRDIRAQGEEFKRQRLEQSGREERRKRDLELYGEEGGSGRSMEESARRIEALIARINQEKQTESPSEPEEDSPGEEEQEQVPEPKEEDQGLQESYSQYSFAKERRAILARILDEILNSVRNLAKKRPDAIVNEYKVTRINTILSEIREKCQGSGYEDLLEMIDPPREVVKDGVTVTEGVTYSDLEVLLDHYHTILYFIRPD